MSIPWSSKGEKTSPVDDDELMLLDSSDANPATTNKRVKIGNLSFSGFVDGPASSVDTAIAKFDGITGKLIAEAGILIDASDNITGITSLQFSDVNTTIQQATLDMQYDVATGGNHVLRINDVEAFSFNATEADWNSLNILNMGTIVYGDGVRQTFNPNATNSGLNIGTQPNPDPTVGIAGDIYFNSTTSSFRGYNGTVWGDIGGEVTTWTANHDAAGFNLLNVGVIESNATNVSSVGTIRLGDLESIGFRNSTNDGDYTIVSDDPTLTFNTWETIEFPDATVIDAGQADFQVLSIDMTGDIVVNSNSITGIGNLVFDDGARITFNPNATNAGLNVGAVATTDPSALVNGDFWYNTGDGAMRARIAGATVDLGALSFIGFTADADLDMANFNVIFSSNGTATATSTIEIYRTAATLNLNADAGDAVVIRAGGTAFMNMGNGAIPSLQMAGASIQQEIGTAAASTGFMSLTRDGNYYHITGTTTITNITTSGWQSGSIIQLNFDGALTVTDAATGSGEIILADSANYVTVAGDVLTLVLDGTQWIEVSRSTVSAGGGEVFTWTADHSAAGFDLNNLGILDFASPADAGTQISADATGIKLDVGGAADTVQIRTNSGASLDWEFRNNTLDMNGNGVNDPGNFLDSNNNELLQWPQPSIASAVNHFRILNATTGNNPILRSESETTVGITFQAGTDGGFLFTNQFGQEILDLVQETGNPANYLQIRSALTTTGPILTAEGSDTNVDLNINPKGTGVVNIGTALSVASTTTTAAYNDSGFTADPSVPVAGDLYFNTTSNEYRSYNGTTWDVLGGGGTGDVVGPASSTDNAIARFDLATGKLLQNSGVTIDDNNTTSHPGPIVLTAQGTVPSGTETYFREVANDLIVNVASAQSMDFNFGTTNRITFTTSGIDLLTNDLAQANIISSSILAGPSVTTGLAYNNGIKQTFNPSGANAGINIGSNAGEPSAPVNGDLVYDTTAAVGDEFKARINGAWVSLGAGGGEVFTWTAAHNQAGFDLVGKATNGITLGQGATDVYSITFLDDTVDAGVLIGNTDGFISFTNESAVANDNQMALTLDSGGATTIQNVMRFQIPVADDTGTTPVLRMDFVDDLGGSISRPLLELTVGATQYLEINNSPVDWTFQVSTTFIDLNDIEFVGSLNTDVTPGSFTSPKLSLPENTAIVWDGAAVSTPNAIGFSSSDAFQIVINNTTQYQFLSAQFDVAGANITATGEYRFDTGTGEIHGVTAGVVIDSPTSTEIQVGGVTKFEFDTNFIDFNGLNIRNLSAIRGDLTGTNEILVFAEVASAVNEYTFTNAATGNDPIFAATGTDTNVGMNITPKGTGVVSINGDATITGDLVMGDRLQGNKGTDVASATTITLNDGNLFDITGTTQIDAMSSTNWQAGSIVVLHFDAALTVTHNTGANGFFLQGAASFVTTADDTLTVIWNGTRWEEISRSVN